MHDWRRPRRPHGPTRIRMARRAALNQLAAAPRPRGRPPLAPRAAAHSLPRAPPAGSPNNTLARLRAALPPGGLFIWDDPLLAGSLALLHLQLEHPHRSAPAPSSALHTLARRGRPGRREAARTRRARKRCGGRPARVRPARPTRDTPQGALPNGGKDSKAPFTPPDDVGGGPLQDCATHHTTHLALYDCWHGAGLLPAAFILTWHPPPVDAPPALRGASHPLRLRRSPWQAAAARRCPARHRQRRRGGRAGPARGRQEACSVCMHKPGCPLPCHACRCAAASAALCTSRQVAGRR
ncbi:MAG: hypothetical protein J3K34DRAFT_264331 [Monoraphidium minutum]|nr:MAG: hypothetical protein J3K34DRAFT_264331 [Monoraphidium minutum]